MKKVVQFLGFKGCVTVLFFALISVIFMQNMERADIDVLLWELVDIPKIYLLAATFASGFLFAVIVLKWPRRKKSIPAPAAP